MAENKVSMGREFTKGIWDENPVTVALLGLCPALAVSNTGVNGLAMGLATTFVIISASTIVSIIKSIVPKQVRIPTYIVIIATFVTLADIFLKAYLPPVSKSLGPYVPLIVVNCLILGRSEAFASKHSLPRAVVDAMGMGVGFTWTLVLMGVIREVLGSGRIFEVQVLGEWFEPWIIMILPGGAFLTLGLLVGVINYFTMKKKS